jgi:type II secretory pathway component PulC
MSLSSRGQRWLILAGLVTAWTCSTVHAEDVAQARSATVAKPETPPFWVVGVVITSAQRSAVLVMLDDARRELGVTTIREGESLGGYRLTAVESDRVLIEQGGVQRSVPVGRPHQGSKDAPDASARKRPPIFIPAPNTATGVPMEPAAQDALQRLLESPQFQQRIEEMRPVLMQRLDRVKQDNHAQPDPPAPAARNREGATQ